MEPLEVTDRYSCEHCGYSGSVGQFRRPGKRGPNFVCPSCYFSSETYYLYLEDKYRPEQSAKAGFPGHYRRQLSPELFQEYEKVERRIETRRIRTSDGSNKGCLLVLIGIPTVFLGILLSR